MLGNDIQVGTTRSMFWVRKIGKGSGKGIKRKKDRFCTNINENKVR